jgi:membrane protease YdiL (CAAX protease family)
MHRQRFLVFVCAVVTANNLLSLWESSESASPGRVALVKLLLGGALIAWSIWIERISFGELGFRTVHIGRSALYGLGAGLVMGFPPMILLTFPIVLSSSVQSSIFRAIPNEAVPIQLLLLAMANVATALFEEFLFRGLFQARGIEWLGVVRGIALVCLLFVLWHTVSAYRGLQATNLGDTFLPFPVLYLAMAVPLAAAGAIFSTLRYKTENLTGSIVAHWLVITLIQGWLVILSTRAIRS